MLGMRWTPLAAMLVAGLAAMLLAGSGPAAAMQTGGADLTRSVPALRETDAVASIDDAADDPAIWRNPADSVKSLIVATDKKAGLNVYGLDGHLRSTIAAGRVNNVDLRSNVMIAGKRAILVAASDRNVIGDGRLALFALDGKAATLTEIARVPIAMAEPYGLCLYRAGRRLYAFVVGKDGLIIQLRIDTAGATATAIPVRTMKLATQSEGCVADDRTATLYVAEEDVGIWRFGAAPDAPITPIKLAGVDGVQLIADVEGLAIAAKGRNRGWLIASSQGDSAYAAWRLPDYRYVGRFRITANGAIGGTSETDGIEISTANYGGDFRHGLMIAQDGDNAPKAQNFKLVRWADIATALRLK